ncbi:hypothetical protein C5167_018354 [Papaver somniferum]|uniref:Uncharacterized protein n=1 Tax=Papaver somniferum TaxID=3469 RepID=A0A4Y7IP88_PAPSO|nr:hypothetical protein C5167_018354 [Papaver somniferum]
MRKAGADPNGAPDGIKALPLAAGVTQIIKPLVDAAVVSNPQGVKILFPVTSHIPSYDDWSINGTMKHVESKKFKKKMIWELSRLILMVVLRTPMWEGVSLDVLAPGIKAIFNCISRVAQKKPPGIVIDGLWVYKGRKTIKYDGVAGFTAGVTNTGKNDCSFSVFSNSLTCSADQCALSKYIVGSSMVGSQAGKVGMTVVSDLRLAQLQHQLPSIEPGAPMQLVEGTTEEDNISLNVKEGIWA